MTENDRPDNWLCRSGPGQPASFRPDQEATVPDATNPLPNAENEAGIHTEVGWAYGVIYDDLHACGCGYADERLNLVRQVLRDCPLHQGTWRNYDNPLAEWLLCLMDGAGLLEHGGSIGGSWLTDKGKRLLAVFEDEQAWTTLLGDNIGYCECRACGYVIPPGSGDIEQGSS